MSNIVFNLNNSGLLGPMAPAVGGIAALPAGMPAAGGMYIIWNTFSNNRYIGISVNIANRFQPRMEVVTELGFTTPQMNQIVVMWGTATIQNTPTFAIPAPLPVVVPGYAAPLNVIIDGTPVNLEKLLIRMVLTQLGMGGTVSNNMMAFGAYANPTGNPINVTLNWGGAGVTPGTSGALVWPVGVPW